MTSSYSPYEKKAPSPQKFNHEVVGQSCIYEEEIEKVSSSDSDQTDDEITENLNDSVDETPSACDLIIKNLTNLKPR